MGVSGIFGRLAERLRAKERTRVTDFWSLALALARGEGPGEDEVEQVLLESGKTLQDLEQATELMGRRLAWRQALERQPELARERAGVERQLQAVEDELRRAQERAHALATPLRARLAAITAAESEAAGARAQLVRTCPYPDLLARREEIGPRVLQAQAHAVALREEVERLEAQKETAGQMRIGKHPTGEYDEKERAAYLARLEKRRGELAEAEARLGNLRRELEAVEPDLLQP